MIKISQLFQYPLKSAKGVALSEAEITPIGLTGDRRLVALDRDGRFITARRYAELLRVSCRQTKTGWSLSHECLDGSVEIRPKVLDTPLHGEIWKDRIEALDCGDEAAQWLSELIKNPVRLALWQDGSRRSGKYRFETSFADASPILLATEASLLKVSEWAAITPDIRRFRPNIVVSGDLEAFEEDDWKHIEIGAARFQVLDTCTRCILTTRNPDTGEAHPERQPLATLSQRHTNADGQALFGVNITLARDSAPVRIAVGDQLVLR